MVDMFVSKFKYETQAIVYSIYTAIFEQKVCTNIGHGLN